jgi:hypothetical protein
VTILFFHELERMACWILRTDWTDLVHSLWIFYNFCMLWRRKRPHTPLPWSGRVTPWS